MIDSSKQHRPRKRKRLVISCTECHRRKQKCDRRHPCCNCIKRGTQDLCRYDVESEGSQPTRSSSGESGPLEVSCSTSTVRLYPPVRAGFECASEPPDEIQNFGYSNHGKHNSRSLLRTIDRHGGQDTSLIGSRATSQPPYPSDIGRKYQDLVRQLPSRACIDILLQTFFTAVNWHYDLVDKEAFREDLDSWRRVSYSELQAGFGRLALGTLVFPALLFQVLAHALLFHPPHDKMIHSLLSISGMTFHHLGTEYSDTSVELLALLGKKDITIATVQAGLLRAAFLKSSGKVVEAWHALGATIRDAQEIGLHTGRLISEPSLARSRRERQNTKFVGHKIWVVLHIWDVHMAVVLGRPIATNLQIDTFAHTIEDDERRREVFSHWQTETDLPRPFDIIVAGYNVAYRFFKDIHQLEQNGASLRDYPTVKRIHATIMKNLELLPSWCRLENPDTRFDRVHGCQWLPFAREGLASLIYIVLLALHRPYIFSVANSRTEALTTGISILRAQERLFQQLEPHQCRVFNPVYASFDAIVLIAALRLVFPNENLERRAECIHGVEKGMQRLGIIGQSNFMAKSAHGVVCSLYHRLRCQFGISEPAENARAFFSNSEWISPNNDAVPYNGAPLEPCLDAVLPPHPTHDLFFDHISNTQMPFLDAPDNLPLDSLPTSVTDGWNFEGAFSDTSFWNLINRFN